MAISKDQIYKFIDDKKKESLKKEVQPLEEKWMESKRRDESLHLVELGADFETLSEKAKDLIKDLTPIREGCEYYSRLAAGDLISSLEVVTNADAYKERVIDCSSVSYSPKTEKLKSAWRLKTDAVNAEFAKLRNVTKSLRTGKQGKKMLEELGFDVSGIVEAEGDLLPSTKFNTDLLGLKKDKRGERRHEQ